MEHVSFDLGSKAEKVREEVSSSSKEGESARTEGSDGSHCVLLYSGPFEKERHSFGPVAHPE